MRLPRAVVMDDNREAYAAWARRTNGEDVREKDTPRCALCSRRLPNGHSFQYCSSCMRRLEAGEKPADIMRGAKDYQEKNQSASHAPRVYRCVECGVRRCARPNRLCEVCKERYHGNNAEDRVTLEPVPDGTRELRYAAKDVNGSVVNGVFKSKCPVCGGEGTKMRGLGQYYCLKCKKEFIALPSAKAKDSLLSSPLLALGALIALWALLHHREVPHTHDLTQYRPASRMW